MTQVSIVMTSDTHMAIPQVPDADIFIHAGDGTYTGSTHALRDWFQWMERLPHEHKLFIAGNHDWGFDLHPGKHQQIMKEEYPSLTYLENSGCVVKGLKFWGSPVQPHFFQWAFQKNRGKELREHWAQIPDDTDVLITHGPPWSFGDTNANDKRFGDQDLLDRVLEVNPRLHVYGHAHHGYGVYGNEHTIFVNAAHMSESYTPMNDPIKITLDC